MVAVWDFTSFWQFICQTGNVNTYKSDKSNFDFESMLFAKFTQAHAAFGREIFPPPLIAIFISISNPFTSNYL